MIDPKTLRCIGSFGKPTGYKGDIALLSNDAAEIVPEMFLFVFEQGLPVPWHVTDVRAKGDDYVVKIKGIDSNTDVARFTGVEAFATEEYLAENGIESDEMLYTDLIGYRLFDDDDEMGTVSDVDDSTENVVFDVLTADGKHILVPAADDFIQVIDETEKVIIMSLPLGLTELN